MNTFLTTRYPAVLAAMAIEAIALTVVVVALGFVTKTLGAPIPDVVAPLAFLVVALGLIVAIRPILRRPADPDRSEGEMRGTLTDFALGYVGNGAVYALMSIREVVTAPHGWADLALLNVVSKAIEVAAVWPMALARLVAAALG